MENSRQKFNLGAKLPVSFLKQLECSVLYLQYIYKFASIHSLLLLQLIGQPIQSFVKSISSCSNTGLHKPLLSFVLMKSKALGHFGSFQRARRILLIGKNQQHCIAKDFFTQQLLQLILCFFNSFLIIAIDDEDKRISTRKLAQRKQNLTQ